MRRSKLMQFSDVSVGEADGTFAGVCLCVDMGRNWTEIAAVLVLPESRGRGMGTALFAAAWERAWTRGRHLYVLSRNPQVVGWMEARGMDVSAVGGNAPLVVHWHMARHMASRHRWAEGFRKRKAIHACPPLRQGIKRQG